MMPLFYLLSLGPVIYWNMKSSSGFPNPVPRAYSPAWALAQRNEPYKSYLSWWLRKGDSRDSEEVTPRGFGAAGERTYIPHSFTGIVDYRSGNGNSGGLKTPFAEQFRLV